MGEIKYITDLLEQYRAEHEYTKSDMSYLLGTSFRHYAQCTLGKRPWPWYLIQAAHHKLGIPAKDLLDASMEPSRSSVKAIYSSNKIAPKYYQDPRGGVR